VNFADRIAKASESNQSKLVLALDYEHPDPQVVASRSKEILEKVSDHICALKINRQLVLTLGLRDGVDSVVKLAHDRSLPAIMDAKLNDVGHTNEFMMRAYIAAGFDAVIVSPIPGWDGGLDGVFRLAKDQGKGVIVLTFMSNPGAEDFHSLTVFRPDEAHRPLFELFTLMAIKWRAEGVVVGATRPETISRVRALAGDRLKIFSPGVGAQGGDARAALTAGADYLIAGRTVYNSKDPREAARLLKESTA